MSENNNDDSNNIEKQDESQMAQNEKKQSDNQVLIDHYKKLMTYKNNLYKLDALIQLENDESTKEELLSMRSDLLQAISYQEDLIKFTQQSDEYFFSVERMTNDYVGRIAKTYNEKDTRWYNAEIRSVDLEEQEAEVYFIGFKSQIKVSSVFVKVLPNQNYNCFDVGTYCDAIYSGGDGNFYPCIIEKIDEQGYHVKFKKYNNREVKQLNHLRESRNVFLNSDNNLKKRAFEDLEELKIPDYLKIMPNDSEMQRVAKKKKIKAMKQAFKNAQLERDNKVKQSSWQQFQTSSFKKKQGYFQNAKESIFKSPDSIEGKVGVMNSGKRMTEFGTTIKLKTEANPLTKLY